MFHLAQIADMPLTKKLDMLSNLADTVAILTEARERRIVGEATLKVAGLCMNKEAACWTAGPGNGCQEN